jgi:hypothetical protein
MRPVARWCVAIGGSAALFAASWLACARAGLDAATSVGVASAVLVITGPILGWWAARDPAQGQSAIPGPAGGGIQAASLAQAAGDAAQAVSGSPAVVSGGRARPRRMTINVDQKGPLPPPPAASDRPPGPVVTGDVPGRPGTSLARICSPRGARSTAVRAGSAWSMR